MDPTIVFNHIPNTAGTTLRIVFNRIYSPGRVYFIDSENIRASLDHFSSLPEKERVKYRVIAGLGANLFVPHVQNPFRITILCEPVERFISQYYYLRKSPNSIYRKDVSRLKSMDEYMDYARQTGQDNLLTRYLAGSIDFLTEPGTPVPEMDQAGDELLDMAKKALPSYDAVMSVRNFDRGVYRLKEMLQWKKVPVYRPVNITKHKSGEKLSGTEMEKVNHLLRFDRAIWDYFIAENLDCSLEVKASRFPFRVFISRQRFINKYLPRV